MLSTQDKSTSTTALASASPTSTDINGTGIAELGSGFLGSDPLGLAPPEVDNRKRFLRCSLFQKREALISLEYIIEVMPLPRENILPVPDMSSSILGVCCWQGDTLWLVDLNHLAGYESLYQFPHLTALPSVIVVQYNAQTLGLVVEHIRDIDLLDEATIQQEIGHIPTSLAPFVMGHCLAQDSVVLSVPAIVNAPQLHTYCEHSSTTLPV